MEQTPTFVEQKPEPAPRVSVESWQRRILAERKRGLTTDRAALGAAFRKLRQRHDEFTCRSQTVLTDPRIKQSGLVVLSRLAAGTSGVSRWIDVELEKFKQSAVTVASPEFMDEMLDVNEQQVDFLRNQLRLLKQVDGYGESLSEIVNELLQAKQTTSARLLDLVRRIRRDVCRPKAPGPPIPESGISVCEYLSRGSGDHARSTFADGIQTAQLVVWTTEHFQKWSDRRELLTAAALLQDSGLIGLWSRYKLPPKRLREEKRQLFEQHPALGAGLTGGINDISIDLPCLIAQHHERLDGTGFPRGLTSECLCESSRLLAVCARFVEIANFPFNTADDEGNSPETGCSPQAAAALTLYREAEQGQLDRELTAAFLSSLGFKLQFEQTTVEIETQPLALSEFAQSRLRLDQSHWQTGPADQSPQEAGGPPVSEPKFRQKRRRQRRHPRKPGFSGYAREEP